MGGVDKHRGTLYAPTPDAGLRLATLERSWWAALRHKRQQLAGGHCGRIATNAGWALGLRNRRGRHGQHQAGGTVAFAGAFPDGVNTAPVASTARWIFSQRTSSRIASSQQPATSSRVSPSDVAMFLT